MSVHKVNERLVAGCTGKLTVLVHVVIVIGNIRSEVVGDVVGDSMRKHIPNTRSSAFIFDGAFDLIGSSRDSPPMLHQYWESGHLETSMLTKSLSERTKIHSSRPAEPVDQ